MTSNQLKFQFDPKSIILYDFPGWSKMSSLVTHSKVNTKTYKSSEIISLFPLYLSATNLGFNKELYNFNKLVDFDKAVELTHLTNNFLQEETLNTPLLKNLPQPSYDMYIYGVKLDFLSKLVEVHKYQNNNYGKVNYNFSGIYNIIERNINNI